MPAWAGLDSINPGLDLDLGLGLLKTQAWAGLDLVNLDLDLDLGLGEYQDLDLGRPGPGQVYKSRPGPA